MSKFLNVLQAFVFLMMALILGVVIYHLAFVPDPGIGVTILIPLALTCLFYYGVLFIAVSRINKAHSVFPEDTSNGSVILVSILAMLPVLALWYINTYP